MQNQAEIRELAKGISAVYNFATAVQNLFSLREFLEQSDPDFPHKIVLVADKPIEGQPLTNVGFTMTDENPFPPEIHIIRELDPNLSAFSLLEMLNELWLDLGL